MKPYLWVVMMGLWLAGLLAGFWWFWPLFSSFSLTADLVAAFFYLLTGTVAWLVALNMGRRRYWQR